MATNKNQHFVPKCHFRPFSRDGAGAAINLFNIDKGASIQNASIKGQCSGDYFYGKDPPFELALQNLEGRYGSLVTRVMAEAYRLDDADKTLLRDFCCLQHLRTDAAAQTAVAMMEETGSAIGAPEDWFGMSILEAVQNKMKAFPAARMLIADLKVVLIRNNTTVPFVTSDDPSAFTNRWHLEEPRLGGLAPGLGGAGALFFLPLTPSILCLVYDGGVYTVEHHRGWVQIDRPADIEAFNAHQYLNCWANIYFHDWNQRDAVRESFGAQAALRPPARYEIHYAILDHEDETGQTFVEVDAATAAQHEHSMFHQHNVLAIPAAWPRQIRWRSDGAAYSRGPGTEQLRRAAVPLLGGMGYRRVRTRGGGR